MNRPDPLPPPRAIAEAEARLAALGVKDASGRVLPEAVTVNLLVLATEEVDANTEAMVEEVMADLLARAYVIRSCPTQAPGSVAIRVTAVEHGAPGSPFVVPRTDLWLGPGVAPVARSVLTPLLRSRLIGIVYVARGADRALVESVLPLGNQVVTDAGEDVELALWVAERSRQSLVDLTLLRGLRWRELVARCFDDFVAAAWEIRELQIEQVPSLDGGAVESELLVAWLGERLGWQPRGAEVFDRAGRPVRVVLRARPSAEAPAGSLQRLELTARVEAGVLGGSITRDARGQRLVWSLAEPGAGVRNLRVSAALPPFLHLVPRALGRLDRDPVAGDTLRWLGRWRAGR